MGSLSLLASAGAGASTHAASGATDPTVEVVVTLPQPPLARAILADRSLAAATTTHHRLNVRTPAAVSYLRTLVSAQRTLQAKIAAAIPSSAVRWHYGVTLDGIAVALPKSQLSRLAAVPGTTVWPSVTYHEDADPTKLIGASTIWGPSLATAGQGMKIGIVDDGLDQSHAYFSPSGFSYPAGFPKGNTAYTTPKVIVARTFSPASNHWKYANTPFDPVLSDHATHVAGIAAGDNNTLASGIPGKPRLSGIAPAAYLGNYKVLTVPTQDFGLDGNSPEIAAGIEAAVTDGMDVINLSLGEPEIEPSRDIVVAALDNAASAGVVPVVAAGNDGPDGGDLDAGKGSVSSPGTAPQAITAAASTLGDDTSSPSDAIAGFSSEGPTPRSLQLKPDVTAPGVDVLSSFPKNQWTLLSGTSMASPHVAGAAALLRQRHPTWTVAQVKSALESTGDPVHPDGSSAEVSTLREGGGRINLVRADNPLLFIDPTSLSFGLVKRGSVTTKQLTLTDAGGGVTPWAVSVAPQAGPAGVSVSPTSAAAVAGSSLGVTATAAATAAEGDATGFVVLTRGTDVRRIPYWLHVEVPRLPSERHHALTHAGVYGGTTKGGASLVSSYRYPEGGLISGVATNLGGPEEVYRVVLSRPLANFGAVVLSRATGVRVSPRIVSGDDENRLTSYDALPVAINPYQNWGTASPAVAVIAPAAGEYEVVFDTPTGTKPGKFTFRFWMNDTTPPSVRLVSRRIARGKPAVFAVADRGSGVDPRSIKALVDGRAAAHAVTNGRVSVRSPRLTPGVHHIQLTVSDYEEAKNMENVGPILPNTRSVAKTVIVR